MSKISLNRKTIHLGYFDNEQDARKAYLNAKLIYHVIEVDNTQNELNELEQLELEFNRIVNN